MAPSVYAALACFAAVVRPAYAANYWIHDRNKKHRYPFERCPNWECPAFERPVQKMESEYHIWSFDGCLNRERTTPFVDELAACCQLKFICALTCGIGVQHCWDQYWQCAEKTCARSKPKTEEDKQKHDWERDCLYAAMHNDFRYLLDKPQDDVRSHSKGEVCGNFHALQRESCECVPQAAWEQTLQARMADFMRKYAPGQLTEKGEFNDKEAWKSWKGNRPQMFNFFFRVHQGALVRWRRVSVALASAEAAAAPAGDGGRQPEATRGTAPLSKDEEL